MEMEKFLSIGKAAKLLGVTPQTIRRWQKEGKIQETRSPTNRRLYSAREVKRILGVRTQEQVVIYARVSSAKQKTDGNLERQVQRLKQYAQDHGYEVSRMFQEQASGINENRKQLHQLLQLAEQHEIQRVLIEFPDRLARFGYRYLERFLSSHGVTVEVTHKTEPKSSQEELVNDLLTIITVFSARLYGKRSQEFRQKAKQLINEMEGGETHANAGENGEDRYP
ncbi:MAG: IS607 family transposase [Firmicutes bacterium]|nr:IS607 family transposase [Bacillota bacterium]MCL5972736.1 IS607 family transposase [Bacillota bacterium]